MQKPNISADCGCESMDWLKKWLEVPFYKEEEKCKKHNYYKTIYCSTCMEHPLCIYCWSQHNYPKLHQGYPHRILKAVRASNRAAIKVVDIAKFVDVSQVQVYIINGDDIFHLHPKLESKVGAVDELCCWTCLRSLKKSGNKFCSIACKFEKEGRNMEIKLENNCGPKCRSSSPSSGIDCEMGETFLLSAPISSPIKLQNPKSGPIKLKIKRSKSTMNSFDQCSSNSSVSLRKRSRKGIPHRAPLK